MSDTSDIISCPSGLSGQIKGIPGKIMRTLGDKQAMRSGVLLDKILGECWLETHDPGPYALKNEKPDWSQVLMGDRMYILLQIRARTFGPKYVFKVQCPNDRCRIRFDYDLDLHELPIKALSDEDKEAFSNGNRLMGELPDGKKFIFKLLIGADEVKAAKASSNPNPLGVLKSRIYEIEDLTASQQNSYFDEGDLSLMYGAGLEMDAHDCGVETGITIDCPDCREVIEMEIPFGRGFLSPQK